MARDDVTARTISWLLWAEGLLRRPVRRWITVGIGIAAVVALHSATGDARVAWISALPAVVGGLAGGPRFGLTAASVAAVGHLSVDLALGVDGTEVAGVIVRTMTFPGLGVVGSVIQRLERQRDEAVLRSVMEDSVTGLLNVRAFYEGLADLRQAVTPYSILLADIAGMRYLNEKYGHPVGTEAIRTLGHALRRSTKKGDLVARLGGDTVAVALVGADAEGAMAAAKRLSEMLHEQTMTLPDGSTFEVETYFGIATHGDAAHDEAALIRAADHALTDAKLRADYRIGVVEVPAADTESPEADPSRDEAENPDGDRHAGGD